MCESRATLPRRVAVGVLCIGLLGGTSRLTAQDSVLPARASAAALRAELDRAEREADSLKERVDALASEKEALFTGRFEAGGRTVRFIPGDLTDADRRIIEEGLTRADSSLRARYGDDLAPFRDPVVWSARSLGPNNPRGTFLSAHRRSNAYWGPRDFNMTQPTVELVEAIALDQAGRNLVDRAPRISEFTRSTLVLNDGRRRFARAGREMALSYASAGRECVAGSPAACRAVLTLPGADGGLSLYFSPADYRSVVTSGELPPTADSAQFAARRRCLAGSDTACVTAVAALSRVPNPFSGTLRSTAVEVALELGGRDAPTRLVTTRDGSALQILATVAGVTEDSLVRAWQQRVRTAMDAESPDAGRDGVTVAAWSLLILFGATRRKP